MARSQLGDLTLQTLYVLQADLNDVLGERAGGDELVFTVDPARFQPAVLASARYFRLRRQVDLTYAHGRTCAALVPRAVEATTVSVILFFARTSWMRNWPSWSLSASLALLIASAVALVASFLFYEYYEGRLERAVVVAEEGLVQ